VTTKLHIQLLGDFRLAEDDGEPLTGANTPRLQSLLAYLLLHRDAPQARSHLAFQFWPDSTEAQARSNLRTLLHRLRQALPEDKLFLHVDAQNVRWRPDAPCSLDVADFEAALAQAEAVQLAGDEAGQQTALEQAVSLYSGDLLPSCYDDWLLPQRERLLQAYLRALERLVDLLERQHAYDQAIAYARQLLRHDPLHEAAYRRLMRLHALKGDRAGALRVYHTCATTLHRELEVEPGPATQRAYEDLLQAEDRPTPTIPTAPGITPLVGREEEWRQLQTAWRRAARGPRFVLLQGEAGIGKTRLVEELLAWAGQQGIAHAYARCYAAEGELAYAPVMALLRSRPLPPLGDQWLAEVARLLPEVQVQHPDLPPPRPMSEAWQRSVLFEALARAVLGEGQPLLLVIDDLQWCDRETLDWLHFLLRFDPRARLLVVGTCRPEELDEDCPLAVALPALHHDVRLREVERGPLDEALAANVTGEALDPEASRRLYRETEGNPLFVVETLQAGLPAAQDRLAVEGGPLPPRVQAVLQTRLSQLSPPARELAGLAATIGREFTFPVLRGAGEADEDALVQGLDELWQRRIVHVRAANAYDFTHDKLREVAYGSLGPVRRQHLHRRVAETLEVVHASEPAAIARRVAVHYDRAGLAEKAITSYLRAGEAANQIFARDEAAVSFQRGLALLEGGSWDKTQPEWRRRMAAELHEGLGDALVYDRSDKAVLAYHSALQESSLEDLLTQVRLGRKLGSAMVGRGHFDDGLEAVDQAEALLAGAAVEPGPELWRETMLIHRWRLAAYYPLGRWRDMQALLETAQPLVEQHGSPADRAWFHNSRALMAMRRDRYVIADETLGDARTALELSERTGDMFLVGWPKYHLGWTLVLRGEFDEAEERLLAALEFCEQSRLLVVQGYVLLWLAILYRATGQVEKARYYASRGMVVGTAIGLPEQIGLGQANLCWVAWRAGDLAQAEELGQAALDCWARGQWVYAFYWAARLPLMAVALDKGQLPEAVEHAGAMLDPRQQKLPDPLEAALEAAVRAAERDQPEEARKHLERAVEVAQETGFL
jgi:DNA-binding SARP family transcriptional activator